MILKFIQHNLWLWITFTLCMGMLACKDFEDCRTDYINSVHIVFENMGQSKITEINSANGSRIYLATQGTQEACLLPLDAKSDSTSFFFTRESPSKIDERKDTLTLFYTKIPSLISPQCGIQQEYILDKQQSTFTKVSIIKPSLRKSDQGPNIKISYPDPEDSKMTTSPFTDMDKKDRAKETPLAITMPTTSPIPGPR